MKNESAKSSPSVFRNWISFIGMVVGIGALFSFLLLFTLDAISKFSNPYVSILTYMGVPGFLIGASHPSDQTCVMSQYVFKSVGAPPHSKT